MSRPARRCSLLLPGDWSTPTGGFQYDRRLVLALQDEGWQVERVALGEGFPLPEPTVLEAAARRIAALPDDECVIADGLAFGVLPDLVHLHAQRLRWVALVHHPLHLETGLAPAQRDHLYALERRALQAARRIVVTSYATRRELAALGVDSERVDVVLPGTDPAPLTLGSRSAGAGLHLLCVATLTQRKGHAVLLQALSGLRDRMWTLHCVGSDERDPGTAERLHAMSRELGLDSRVHWHGTLDPAALDAQYAAADLFVLPSLYEGYGMVVAEALARGLPVLASRAGALAETLPADAGLLVPPGDPAALAEGLARMIDDTRLRTVCAAGARRARQRLPTWPQTAARFAEVLEAVA